jgi:O-antigen/teichoic acid export membrane protein
MRFTAVSTNNIVGRLVAVVVSILLALTGWGYWALVAGYIAQQLSMSVGAWILCRWTPGLPTRASDTNVAVKFAINVYSHFSLSYLAGNTDNLLVGWRYGAQALGFYKKAFDMFFLPLCQLLSPISAVVVTTLSRFNRERDQYQRYLLAGMSVLAFLGMAIGADFTLVSKDLIRLFLGRGWEETGQIFAFFGPGIGIMLLYNTHGWIHVSSGRPERWFRWGLIELFCTVCLFVMALPWGPKGIALAWTVSFFVLIFPGLWYAGRPIGLGVGPILATVWKFFVASVVAAFITAWLIHMVPQFAANASTLGALARLVSYSLLFFTLYLSAVVALHRGLEPIHRAAHLIGDFLPRRSPRQTVAVVPSAAADELNTA